MVCIQSEVWRGNQWLISYVNIVLLLTIKTRFHIKHPIYGKYSDWQVTLYQINLNIKLAKTGVWRTSKYWQFYNWRWSCMSKHQCMKNILIQKRKKTDVYVSWSAIEICIFSTCLTLLNVVISSSTTTYDLMKKIKIIPALICHLLIN